MSLLEVDGAQGEGGGQILRTALALAALRRRPVRVTDVRAGRPKPGLARQHLTAVQALAALCEAKTEGVRVGSREVVFRPGRLRGGPITADVGTAGSVTLVLQACLLPALFAAAPSRLRIRGGTDVRWSPPADYTARVFLPLLARLGGRVSLRILRRGYYPRGGGEVEVTVEPVTALRPFRVEAPGPLRRIEGVAHVANLPGEIATRMKRSALKALVGVGETKVQEAVLGPTEAEGRGGALVLWAETERTLLGASAVAERGVPAEALGQRAAEALAADLTAGATLDVHAADQLLPYLPLAEGPSTLRVREVTGHIETLLGLLPQFVDATFRTAEEDGTTRVEVRP
jgi:RNA 3'-phosphate cyclase